MFGQVPTNGLIGYYPFTGNANDQVATLSNGTVNGATLVSDRFGNANSAYSFNGTSDYISFPTTKYLVNSYTYSFWMKITSNPTSAQYMMSIGSPAIGGAEGYASFLGANKGIGFGSYAVSGSSAGSTISSPPALNQWHHVCITRGSAYLSMYVDGKYVDSQSTGGSNPQYGTGTYAFLIGTRFNNANYFNGSLDDLRIYNRAVSATEVKSLYNETFCFKSISVTDTLVINGAINNYNPIGYVNTIKIYPNPTKDKIIIDNGDFSKYTGYTVKILNSTGGQVFSSLVNQKQFTVDFSKFASTGIYFVHVIDDKSNTLDVRKLIFQ
jgi:hypothetical protein